MTPLDLRATFPVAIDRRQVLRLQGYKRITDVPTPDVTAILDEALREAHALLQPAYIFERFPVASVTEETVELHRGARLALAGAIRRWGPFREVGLGVCSIGDALERRVDVLLARREFPLAFMLDSAGWVAVEALADALGHWACNRLIAEGIRAAPRLSPGFSGWDIWDQRVLFELLPARRIGVCINDYCVMIPGKSLSFGMGLGPDVRADQTHKCHRCDLADCAYRLAPYRGVRGGEAGASSAVSPGDHQATLRHLLGPEGRSGFDR